MYDSDELGVGNTSESTSVAPKGYPVAVSVPAGGTRGAEGFSPAMYNPTMPAAAGVGLMPGPGFFSTQSMKQVRKHQSKVEGYSVHTSTTTQTYILVTSFTKSVNPDDFG